VFVPVPSMSSAAIAIVKVGRERMIVVAAVVKVAAKAAKTIFCGGSQIL
jgi:hypothetical protein